MPSPRPILKPPPSPTLSSTSPLPFPFTRNPTLDSPRVHFPPTPTLTQMEMTHSPFIYDRKPIVVLPNVCAMPERGERAMDYFLDADYDLDVRSTIYRSTKKAKGGYFHPRAYEAAEYECEGEQPEQQQQQQTPPLLLFAREGIAQRFHNDAVYDDHGRHAVSYHHRSVPAPLVLAPLSLDSPDLNAADSASTTPGGHFNLHTIPMDPCQFVQHIPNMDLSLSFLPRKKTAGGGVKTHSRKESSSSRRLVLEEENVHVSSPHKKATTTTTTLSRTCGTGSFERTRKVANAAAVVASCGGFSSGFCEPGLEGCLGGF